MSYTENPNYSIGVDCSISTVCKDRRSKRCRHCENNQRVMDKEISYYNPIQESLTSIFLHRLRKAIEKKIKDDVWEVVWGMTGILVLMVVVILFIVFVFKII